MTHELLFTGCFKRKRSLTPAYGPPSSSSPLSDTSSSAQARTVQAHQSQTQSPSAAVAQSHSAKVADPQTIPIVGTTQTSVHPPHHEAAEATIDGDDSKKVATTSSTIISLSTTQAPRTAKITSASALAYAFSSSPSKTHHHPPADTLVYGGADVSKLSDNFEGHRSPPPLPIANSRIIWSGSPGPGPYGDYKPVSVLDNRNYAKSTGNLADFDYTPGYMDRGGSRSRPMTPSCGYGPPGRTIDRMARTEGARTPLSSHTFIVSEKTPPHGQHYSTSGGSTRSSDGTGYGHRPLTPVGVKGGVMTQAQAGGEGGVRLEERRQGLEASSGRSSLST